MKKEPTISTATKEEVANALAHASWLRHFKHTYKQRCTICSTLFITRNKYALYCSDRCVKKACLTLADEFQELIENSDLPDGLVLASELTSVKAELLIYKEHLEACSKENTMLRAHLSEACARLAKV